MPQEKLKISTLPKDCIHLFKMITPDIETALCRYFNQIVIDHLGVQDSNAIEVAKTAFIQLLKATDQPAAETCTYIFTKGKNKDQQCGVQGCKKHASKPASNTAPVPAPVDTGCSYVFAKGKNKGQTCGAKNCKKHTSSASPGSSPAPVAEQAPQVEPVKIKGSGPSGFDFETEAPVKWSEENMKWWKNWRTIQAETCGESGCRWHRTTKIVIRLDEETSQPILVGLFDGKFTTKSQMSGAAYNWCKNSGIKV
jgi:hypothetical protein